MSIRRKSKRSTERGTVVLLATATLLILVGMLALAVDLGYLMSGRGQLQNTVDASALAAAQGLRTTIEAGGARTHQEIVTRNLAKDFASFNLIKRIDGNQGLVLTDSDIGIEYPPDYPIHQARVVIKKRTALPTIFGNVFGLSSFNVSAVAVASTFPVDGGTGTISGCWRPIMIPDTFYDENKNVWSVSDPCFQARPNQYVARPTFGVTPPNCNPTYNIADNHTRATNPGDYYVSPYYSEASGTNRGSDFFARQVGYNRSYSKPLTIESTGVRDSNSINELRYSPNGGSGGGGRNLIGLRMRLGPNDYRIIDFAASAGFENVSPSDPIEQLNRGVCTQVRIGQLLQLKSYTDPANEAIYERFHQQLRKNFFDAVNYGKDPTNNSDQYRYAQTQRFLTPNSSPRVIPVLMCNPTYFDTNSVGQFVVTNFGAFFLDFVNDDGSMSGYFVREVITGGTPIEASNNVIVQSQLPVSVNLVR